MGDESLRARNVWKRIAIVAFALLLISNIAWTYAFLCSRFPTYYELNRDLDLSAAHPAEPETAPIDGIARAGAQFQIHATKSNIFYVSFHTLVTSDSLETVDSLPDWWVTQMEANDANPGP